MKKVANTLVVNQEEAGQLTPEDVGAQLPPSGHERDELLRKRIDELEAKLAAITDTNNGGVDIAAVDPKQIERDNEILTYLDNGSFPVLNADDTMVYAWVQRDQFGKYGGKFVHVKKMLGWEMVYYGDPEVAGSKSPEGYCVIGDVVLMKVNKLRYLQIHRRQQKVADDRRRAGNDELRQIGDKLVDKGIITRVESDLTDTQVQRMAKQAEAKRRANALSDKWIREGKMPGVPGPTAHH
jgi:hypothetical protein